MSKTKRRRIQRDQQIQKRHRERFLAALASGSSPTRAAKQAGIGRSTLYEARCKHRWTPSVTEKNCTRRRNELIAKGAMNTGE